MRPFKVGDRVRILNSCQTAYYKDGDIVTIIDVQSRYSSCTYVGEDGRNSQNISNEYIELTDPKQDALEFIKKRFKNEIKDCNITDYKIVL